MSVLSLIRFELSFELSVLIGHIDALFEQLDISITIVFELSFELIEVSSREDLI